MSMTFKFKELAQVVRSGAHKWLVRGAIAGVTPGGIVGAKQEAGLRRFTVAAFRGQDISAAEYFGS